MPSKPVRSSPYRSTPYRGTPHRSDSTQRHARQIARALAHVDTHLAERLDAQVLADCAAMSRHHFHRLFAAHVGCSVAGYITGRRLQKACTLLVGGHDSVLDVALAVGYESAQALAKAMRRELDATPSAVRRGQANGWTALLLPARPADGMASVAAGTSRGLLGLRPAAHTAPHAKPERNPMEAPFFATIPTLTALTATARGMVGRDMSRSARQAYGELFAALRPAGLVPQMGSCIGLCPDEPQGDDDPNCRYLAGAVFGYDLAQQQGIGQQPALALSGSLAWWPIAGGRHAVFTHHGPYSGLNATWKAIYSQWLPASGETLRDAAPFEVNVNDASCTPPEDLITQIWLPLA